jgi:hypothetical protein
LRPLTQPRSWSPCRNASGIAYSGLPRRSTPRGAAVPLIVPPPRGRHPFLSRHLIWDGTLRMRNQMHGPHRGSSRARTRVTWGLVIVSSNYYGTSSRAGDILPGKRWVDLSGTSCLMWGHGAPPSCPDIYPKSILCLHGEVLERPTTRRLDLTPRRRLRPALGPPHRLRVGRRRPSRPSVMTSPAPPVWSGAQSTSRKPVRVNAEVSGIAVQP